MSVKTGQAVTVLFATSNASTGAAEDASSTPTGTLYVNGTANGASVTVTNITTGLYKAAVTLPSLSAGDVVSLRIAATVSSVSGEGVVWQEVADTYRVSDVKSDTDDIGVAGAGLSAIPWNSDWDAEVESEVDDALGGGTGTALTAVPWNANWDAEVQSEVQDALVANDLDHLIQVSAGSEEPTDGS